jgi:hypothetical protein
MPRYRIAFAREWSVGRWGYLDRFFHDLGGRESEPSGLENAWVVDFRGNPRRLGRELAMALNIAEADFRKFGPIFEIEELAGPRPPPVRREEPPARTEASAPQDWEPAAAPREEPAPQPEEPEPGPTWIQAADVEDVPAEAASAEPLADTPPGAQHATSAAANPVGDSASRAQTRWDDLFRIRRRNRPIGRHRAEVISEAARRKPPADGSPLE